MLLCDIFRKGKGNEKRNRKNCKENFPSRLSTFFAYYFSFSFVTFLRLHRILTPFVSYAMKLTWTFLLKCIQRSENVELLYLFFLLFFFFLFFFHFCSSSFLFIFERLHVARNCIYTSVSVGNDFLYEMWIYITDECVYNINRNCIA